MSTDIRVTPSSGNVFADLNLPNPEERLVKATIALSIGELIEKRGLTQEEARTILGLPQSSVSNLVRGKLGKFTIDRLLRYMRKLEYDVTISFKLKPKSYPSPPSGLKITPDVKSMYDRLMRYLSGKEPLASMAYFCLTVLEISTRDRCKKAKDAGPKSSKGEIYRVELASVVCPQVVPTWRATAAEMYGIERAVLNKIGHLSSKKGARKADGQEALTDPEARFLKEAIKALIHRAAEVAYGPVSRLPEIKLTDLLKC